MRQRVRALLATPRFTIVALVTITVLVCGITTIFSVVDGVLLRALPYPDAERLVRIEVLDPLEGTPRTPRQTEIERFQNGNRSFDMWASYRLGYVAPMPDLTGAPKLVQDVLVSPNALSAFGFQAVRGRLLSATEREPVGVISDSLWKSVLGGAEDVVGRTALLGGTAVTIIGVVRVDDQPPFVWLSTPTIYRPISQGNDSDPTLTTIARLAGDRTVTEAQAELETRSPAPGARDRRRPRVTPLLDAIVGDSGRLVWLFFGVAGLILLIGVGNLTSLQMARNSERRREVLTRFALGASRPRVIRELTAESAIIGAIGGVAGLMTAAWAIRIVVNNLPARFPRADQIGIDIEVALFAMAIALAASLIVGLIGALSIASAETTTHLTDASIKGASRPVLQSTLIGGQTAAAMILLVGTGLLLGSLTRLIARDSGMQENDLWMAVVSLPLRHPAEAARAQFWNEILAEVKQIPSVQDAAMMVNMNGPLSGSDNRRSDIVPQDSTVDPRSVPPMSYRQVSSNYFSTVGMRIKRGRAFAPDDDATAERVAVINELAASMLWPGQDAVGKRFVMRQQLTTVVGVIADYWNSSLDGAPGPQIYVPADQSATNVTGGAILFRAANQQAVADVRSILLGKMNDMVVRTASMADQRWRLVALERFRIAVISAFALTAVVLAIVGVAGLVGYTVARRAREVAIRIALGAAQTHIMRVTTLQTLLPAALGILAGIIGAIGATRLIRSYLVDITPLDPFTYLAAITALAIAVVLASLLPARRAIRMDPAAALRRD